MGKKYKNLFESVYDINNLRLAYQKTVRGGNRYTVGHLKFKENIEANLYILQQQIKNQTYKHGAYHEFKVYEPKERIIHSLPFRDRLVQHSINNIIEPIFESVFYPCSFACRKNKGTHIGVRSVQSDIRRLSKTGAVYYLKMDFSKYFHKINKEVLFREISKKIKDKKLLLLLASYHDDKKAGIPIGNLLSQLFANIYGHIFDRFVKTKIKARYYYRYMDDTVILSNNKEELKTIQIKLQKFIKIFMKLNFSKWFINKVENQSLNFLGYRIKEDYKLIRKDSVVRAKRKIKRYIKLEQWEKLDMFLASWLGHLKSADSFNLVNYIKGVIQCYIMLKQKPTITH